jgi:hypothetical protein
VDRLERLPVPQREALRTAFGLSSGSAPDRFLVGLATLSLLADVAEEHPLVCLVDDEQWLDRASAQVLGFVARRLEAEPIGLVLAARVPSDELAGLPELVVQGLGKADARALLEAALTGPLDAQVRDRLVAETGGNPLALLELPQGLTPAELAGGSGTTSRRRHPRPSPRRSSTSTVTDRRSAAPPRSPTPPSSAVAWKEFGRLPALYGSGCLGWCEQLADPGVSWKRGTAVVGVSRTSVRAPGPACFERVGQRLLDDAVHGLGGAGLHRHQTHPVGDDCAS